MKLLILTQKIDKNDSVLGFMHGWVNEFAKNFEFITAICLQKGEYDLPDNVKVLGLGKPASRAVYLFNFYKHIWRERKNYDAVFVHMNQEYILLGGLFWKLFGKKVFMWRNHKKGETLTKIAGALSDKVFYTSDFSYTAKFKNAVKMPAGVDTEKFKSQISNLKSQNRLLSLGRIDPVKKVHILVDALKLIRKLSLVDVYGDGQGEYYENIKKEIKIFSGVANDKTPEIYNQHDVFVNMTLSGSFDKTIVEAMACGLIPVVCNRSLAGILPGKLIFKEDDVRDLAAKIEYALNMPQNEREALTREFRKWVEENHSLGLLVKKIKNEFEK
jgi:glycosyltransferase involved in cell wall biosynthesis